MASASEGPINVKVNVEVNIAGHPVAPAPPTRPTRPLGTRALLLPTPVRVRVDPICGNVICVGDQQTTVPSVPRTVWAKVYGEVMKPGSYPLEDNVTVLKAISIAGGFTKSNWGLCVSNGEGNDCHSILSECPTSPRRPTHTQP